MQNQCKTNAKPMQNHFQGHTGLMQNRLVFDLIQIDKNKKKVPEIPTVWMLNYLKSINFVSNKYHTK